MLDTLITSKTRIKLLIRFFLNPEMTGYLRGLEQEFGEGSNAIRLELNRFEDAGFLDSAKEGNRKVFRANRKHPLYRDLNLLIRKYVGIDQLVERVTQQAGDLEAVYVTGNLARGLDSQLLDIVIVGETLNENYLLQLAAKAEELIHKKVRWVFFTADEFLRQRKELNEVLMIWQNERSVA